ncbi:L-aminoadipate-semialdehyde dehydrogenase-phosphopantetheinyl transferase [Leptinotarsa decemlineata]|uniref:L-aminoadipate-semialdehyde dehydrogenase-phosphopantetheinyl transferase n=1 Tax=Leptinotarsa decemlineata TaxID=7539 RepID=UPI003D30C489
MNRNNVRWAFNISKWRPSHSDILLASSCIQTEEKVRLTRFVFKKDLEYSLIGLLMLRKLVCEASDKKYNEIKFIRSDKGKPLLHPDSNVPKLHFNVSHHGNYTVCAGESGDIMLGVDVMKLEYQGGKSISEFFRIMDRQFSSVEWDTIKGAGDETEQKAMFCRHWSLKESYVKAKGVGITFNLKDTQFRVKTKKLSSVNLVTDTELYLNGIKLNWRFEEMLLDAEHCVSVAIGSDKDETIDCDGESLFKEISFEQLMENCVPLTEADETFCENYFKKLEKT